MIFMVTVKVPYSLQYIYPANDDNRNADVASEPPES